MGSPATDEQLLYTVKAAAIRLAIGRTMVYELLASGTLRSVRVGRARRIPASALAEFVASLEAEAER